MAQAGFGLGIEQDESTGSGTFAGFIEILIPSSTNVNFSVWRKLGLTCFHCVYKAERGVQKRKLSVSAQCVFGMLLMMALYQG